MKINKETGEIATGKLNEIKTVLTKRANGSTRIQQDFENCPSMAEQHSAHETDINHLISKFQPDQLQAYLNLRNQMRPEITDHDFSREPDMQNAKNEIYRLKQAYADLPEEITNNFRSLPEFLKFIDNPQNEEKMIKLGLLNKAALKQFKPTEPEPKPKEPTDPPKTS